MPYDIRRDFVPVAHIAGVPNVLVVTPASGIHSVDDLIKQARTAPGRLSYGSAGSGTSLHLAGELFGAAARVGLLHIPYKGAAPATADLLGGQITMMFNTVPVALPLIRSGKLTALAVTSAKRHFALPEVPTFAELGYASVASETWVGLFAPAGTPRELVDKLAQALDRSLRDKSVVELLRKQGAEPQFMDPAAFARYVDSEIARWGGVVRAAGIKRDSPARLAPPARRPRRESCGIRIELQFQRLQRARSRLNGHRRARRCCAALCGRLQPERAGADAERECGHGEGQRPRVSAQVRAEARERKLSALARKLRAPDRVRASLRRQRGRLGLEPRAFRG